MNWVRITLVNPSPPLHSPPPALFPTSSPQPLPLGCWPLEARDFRQQGFRARPLFLTISLPQGLLLDPQVTAFYSSFANLPDPPFPHYDNARSVEGMKGLRWRERERRHHGRKEDVCVCVCERVSLGWRLRESEGVGRREKRRSYIYPLFPSLARSREE